ncbi:Potassium voltage-gated channel protein Shaw [Trachymyrmex cornetzi]|uniref:Potassium voltage-gated channel protein Shaw n=1 Tax=Trachymyrmex cornetzi TaxID=471704 RepID=A0A195DHS6_9HYME|nr:Potassium voltage-gated channel protein Shaw [Trachymyrmex cornetzi]
MASADPVVTASPSSHVGIANHTHTRTHIGAYTYTPGRLAWESFRLAAASSAAAGCCAATLVTQIVTVNRSMLTNYDPITLDQVNSIISLQINCIMSFNYQLKIIYAMRNNMRKIRYTYKPSYCHIYSILVLFDEPYSSAEAKRIACVSIFFIHLSVFRFCVKNHGPVELFTLKILRCFVSPSPKRFTMSSVNVIDLVVTMSFYRFLTKPDLYLELLSIALALRLFKLTRHLSGIFIHTFKASVKELVLLVFFLILGILFFASLMFYVERSQVHIVSNFSTFYSHTYYVLCKHLLIYI